MPGLFSRLKSRDGKSKKKSAANDLNQSLPPKRQWDDAYTRKTVDPEEIHELIHCCTEELKARGLDQPFLLLPFRPTSDPSAVRTFVRHFFEDVQTPRGEALIQELRMTEPMVISGVIKWCWSRLQGGVVGWDSYELFKVGEHDSKMDRESFKTFVPISVENGARQRIIFDFFDLMAAIAAHGKANGFGGLKLSRMAAWWAFEHKDTGKGFEGGYNTWVTAADATSHLFFAYLRSLSPEQALTGITMLPRSLEALLQETEYPPTRTASILSQKINKIVMVVDTVSPTPFALLRRANHFQYRDSDRELQEFSEFEDPVQALTEECRRVLKAISSANQSHVSSIKHSTSLRDASWSRFEDIGFASALEEDDEDDESALARHKPIHQGPRKPPALGSDLARPVTPSWADFLSSGFVDDNPTKSNVLLPPDKVLPPIDGYNRQHSSQSHRPRLESDRALEPAELASITLLDLDDAFWWVWMSSLAPEEPADRKAAFGRCAVIETKIRSGHWLVMEEMVAGAAPEPLDGAYLAEKKGFFSWTRRGKSITRRKSTSKRGLDRNDRNPVNAFGSTTSFGPDTHAKIQAKAAQLRAVNESEKQAAQAAAQRRGRTDSDAMTEKTNSVLTLQPNIVGEASSALKWVKKYDKGTIKDAYLSNSNAGRGTAVSPAPSQHTNGYAGSNGVKAIETAPAVPPKETAVPAEVPVPQQQASVVSSAHEDASDRRVAVPDKTEEADIHPLDRAQPEPAPQTEVGPETPKKDEAPTLTTEDSEQSLGKDGKEKSGGFRRLFSRKNRASKLPPNAANDVNSLLRQDQIIHEPPTKQATTTDEPATTVAKTDSSEDAKQTAPESDTPDQATPTEVSELTPEPTYQPRDSDDLARVDTRDNTDADKEFARFDQGPLSDQPAFVPDDDVDDATPPPISRHPQREPKKIVLETTEEKLSQSAGPGVQDRWAQIRKNAANRAANRQSGEFIQTSPGKAVDGDDDTSGEETIESRVARIKARVAELTGNMDGSGGPQQQSVAGQR